MIFAVDSLVITAADRQLRFELGQRTEGMLVLLLGFGGENRESNSFEPRSGAGKI